jgi:membrane-bound ClpP family serine protease
MERVMTDEQKPVSAENAHTEKIEVEPVTDSFLKTLIGQIGKPFVQGLLALAIVGALVYKFVFSDVSVPIEVYIGMAGIIIGFYFGKEVSK